MGFIKEFKDFAMRGNLIDMAVGIVIGAAFGSVTKVFIDGIFMPIVGLIFQVGDLSAYVVKIGTTEDGAPNLVQVGSFISAIINFIIIAFAMFLLIKGMNAMKRKHEEAPAAPPAPSNQEVLLSEIRDLLKNQK
ncbi:MAG: large-conductance mechanosensitive channel protein MscL [Bacteroidia bacterium]